MGYLKHRKQTKIEIINIDNKQWEWTITGTSNQRIGASTVAFNSEEECLEDLDTIAHDIIIFVKAARMG